MNITNIGTQVKFAVSLSCAGLNMDDFDFTTMFYTTTANRAVTLAKEDLVRDSESNYIAVVDTTEMPAGEIKMRVEATIPDNDIEGGERKEITTTTTGVFIRR